MKKLIAVYSDQYLKYDFGPDHPFWPQRAAVFLEKLRSSGIPFEILSPPKASAEDILLAHSKEYLHRVKELALSRGALSLDTPVNPDVWETAYFSVGGSVLTMEKALQGERAVNLLGGMHHAGIEDSSGFCIFNDLAIAIRKLQKEGKIKTAMVYDLDVHAGNGTQEIFYFDPTVFTISLHQDPETIYPGTGFAWEEGEGLGLGFNKNVVLSPGTGGKEYLKALDSVLPEADVFRPDLIVLILGVDTYKEDPLASLKLDEDDYRQIGERFKGFDKVAVMFAGGYSRKTPELWMDFLMGFLDGHLRG